MKLAEAPRFSIVIPTYNRPAQLAICLEACAGLDYPHDRVEVIVVDDGGNSPLDEIVSRFHGVLTLKLLRQENAGPAAARNRGVAEASGEFLAFTDDDCSPAPNWLRALADQCLASPGCAVGGQTRNVLTHNLYSTASQLLISYLFSYYNAVPGAATFFPSSNLAFPLARFREVGGFDTTYPRAAGEDRELCDRWLHYGHRMVYAAEAVVYHAHDLGFLSYWFQHFHYGQGALCFHQVRARRGHRRIKVEPPMFYLNMLRYPFATAQGLKAPVLTLLLATAQVANATGFFWERTVRGDTTTS